MRDIQQTSCLRRLRTSASSKIGAVIAAASMWRRGISERGARGGASFSVLIIISAPMLCLLEYTSSIRRWGGSCPQVTVAFHVQGDPVVHPRILWAFRPSSCASSQQQITAVWSVSCPNKVESSHCPSALGYAIYIGKLPFPLQRALQGPLPP